MKARINRVSIENAISLCLRVVAVVCVCAAFLTAQSGRIATENDDQTAKDAVAAAAKAFGGAEKIDGIKSLIIKGKITSVSTGSMMGNTNRAGEFEIRMRWPDDYIRIERYPDRTSTSGVSQGKSFPSPISIQFSSKGDVIDTTVSTVDRTMEYSLWRMMSETAHILIGTIMKSGMRQTALSSTKTPGVFNLSFPQPDGVISEIEFDSKTGYPSVIRWAPPLPSGSAPNQSIVYQFSGERFAVGGIMFPRVINETSASNDGQKTVIERRIEEVIINPELSLKDFEAP